LINSMHGGVPPSSAGTQLIARVSKMVGRELGAGIEVEVEIEVVVVGLTVPRAIENVEVTDAVLDVAVAVSISPSSARCLNLCHARSCSESMCHPEASRKGARLSRTSVSTGAAGTASTWDTESANNVRMTGQEVEEGRHAESDGQKWPVRRDTATEAIMSKLWRGTGAGKP
jgi:hypothetical protein